MLPFPILNQYGNIAPDKQNNGIYNIQEVTGTIPSSRKSPALCTGNGLIYVYGGGGSTYGATNTDLLSFDVNTNTYTIIKSNLDGIRLGSGMVYYAGDLYFFGYTYKSNNTNGSFFKYNLSTGVKTNIINDSGRPSISAYHDMILVDSKIYVMPGNQSSIYVYDIILNVWTRKNTIGFNKFDALCKMCYLDYKLYIIGRLYNNFLIQYDISTNSTTNMTLPPGVTSEFLAANFYVQVIGSDLYGFVQSTVYRYNFNISSWVLVNDSNGITIGETSYINSPISGNKAIYSFNNNSTNNIYKIT